MDDSPGEGPYERRMSAEWDLLRRLSERNPGRLTDMAMSEGTMRLWLRSTPAALPDGSTGAEHLLSFGFPVHYPAVPMTLHLARPVLHPNVHPRTGFVCLWLNHRISNTVEHALHKTVAMMGWRLFNPDPTHIMQPEALPLLEAAAAGAGQPGRPFAPLLGVEDSAQAATTPRSRRVRLS
jgi:ubiquitin-protein ligase